jgi:hypothetical protein
MGKGSFKAPKGSTPKASGIKTFFVPASKPDRPMPKIPKNTIHSGCQLTVGGPEPDNNSK